MNTTGTPDVLCLQSGPVAGCAARRAVDFGFSVASCPAAILLLHITPLLEPPGVRVEGDLDLASAPVLSLALAAMSGGSVRVDLSDLGFIDVSGLRVLVVAAARLAGHGHVLILRRPPRQMLRLLVLTRWYDAPGIHLEAESRDG